MIETAIQKFCTHCGSGLAAKFCGECGAQAGSIVPVEPVHDAKRCPSCRSNAVRALSVVYESGASRQQATIRGGGWGIGTGGLDHVSGKYTSQGTSITELARRAAPPERLKYMPLWGVLGGSIVGCAFMPLFLIGIFFAVTFLVVAFQHNRGPWPKLYAAWKSKLMCGDCGWVYTPA